MQKKEPKKKLHDKGRKHRIVPPSEFPAVNSHLELNYGWQERKRKGSTSVPNVRERPLSNQSASPASKLTLTPVTESYVN